MLSMIMKSPLETRRLVS